MFSGFGMLSSIKIHFSQVKIVSIEIGCEVYSRFKVMNGFFGIAYKKKKAGHFNTPLKKMWVGIFNGGVNFYYLLH